MKKAILIIIVILLLNTGCQATPVDDIVVQKDTDEMLEAAATFYEESIETPIKGQLEAPDEITEDLVFADGKLMVDIDTEITVPDVNAISIVEVQASEFTQENTDGLINAFYEGESPYELTQGRATKSAIEQTIIKLEAYQLTCEDDPLELEYVEQRIEELKGKYADAPEESEDIIEMSDGQLKLMTTPTNDKTVYFGLNIITDKDSTESKSLFVHNRLFKESDPSKFTDLNAWLIYWDLTNFKYQSNGIKPKLVCEDTQLDEDLGNSLGFTPKEAVSFAQDILHQCAADYMAVNRIYVINSGEASDDDIVTASGGNYAYHVFFTRKINGVTCAYDINSQSVDENGGYQTIWDYERLEMVFNREGVAFINWVNPYKINEVRVEQTSMLVFSDIYDRFTKQVEIRYSYFSDELKSVEIDIDRIALEYHRMSIKDGEESVALLVPVWNFYGVETLNFTTETTSDENFLISVNAIDGSIFNPTLGY